MNPNYANWSENGKGRQKPNEKIIIAEIPGPGAQVDDYTVMAKTVNLDLSAMPAIIRWGFCGKPVGETLGAWQEKGRVFLKAKINTEVILLPPNTEMEFHPSFSVQEMRIIDGKRVINAADLVGISVGFKKVSWWKRFWRTILAPVARGREEAWTS